MGKTLDLQAAVLTKLIFVRDTKKIKRIKKNVEFRPLRQGNADNRELDDGLMTVRDNPPLVCAAPSRSECY